MLNIKVIIVLIKFIIKIISIGYGVDNVLSVIEKLILIVVKNIFFVCWVYGWCKIYRYEKFFIFVNNFKCSWFIKILIIIGIFVYIVVFIVFC